MIDWPENLVDDIARRRAVIVVGSGVSKNSAGKVGKRPPTWSEFLKIAVNECPNRENHIRSAIKRGDYLTACEWLKHKLDEKWVTIIRREFVEPGYKAAEIHELIFKADVRFVITPNFDKIYDNYASQASEGTILIKNYNDADIGDVFRGNKRAIIKAHGSIDSPVDMVFTREDYARVRTTNPRIYNVLDALLMTHTFLFVGCGIDDPDFRLLLEKYSFEHKNAAPHYMTLCNPVHRDLEKTLRTTMNIKAIKYSKKNNHEELTDSFRKLNELVEFRRDELAKERGW